MTEEIRECYRLLEAEPGASTEAIKQMYHELIKVWHPDRFLDGSKLQKRAGEKTKAINAAYEKIKAYQSGTYSEPKASTSSRAAEERARRAKEESEQQAREHAEARAREEARVRAEERRRADERAQQQEQCLRDLNARAHGNAMKSADLWECARRSAGKRTVNNLYPALFSAFPTWHGLGFGHFILNLCFGGLFCAVPVFLVSLLYYAASGRIPPADKIEEKQKSSIEPFSEFNPFTLIAIGLAVVWFACIRPSIFPMKAEVLLSTTAGAEKGDPQAQFELGRRYDNGDGVRQDYTEAARWYRKAAEQGHIGAECYLGLCYAKGQGMPQYFEEAAKWFGKAAQQGDGWAQNYLGIMCQNGQGLPKDLLEAYKWYALAAAQGNTNAQINRDDLLRSLTPAQIAEGQRRAAAPTPYKPE